ncbi:MAG: glycosyltransferase [Saprospiraceae bacterium]|nr:glycosyltransferase [Saprospiraceae bacterium]
MKLSIIIVSYNVRFFLEEAIASAFRAAEGIESEIIVVDNASADDSCEMIRTLFPKVKLIESDLNLGFGKANNLGLKIATGEYILFLNPDTIVAGDALQICLSYLEEHPEYGACGVRMLDGSGKILPESKRGFPTPWVSFCKMLGLHKLFPHSKLFNGYYLGHLSYEENQDIEVLSGAFIFVRKKVLDQIGGFDEKYFMYGEDIDLSTRILRSGCKIAYLSNARIVHYKGESTKKSSLSYFKSFYEAMLIFSEKYMSQNNKRWFVYLLKLAIVLKGILSWIKSILISWLIFLLDAAALLLGIYLIKIFWSKFYFQSDFYFEVDRFWINAALFTTGWLMAFYFNGLYDDRPSRKSLIVSAIGGFILNLLVYALLPESMRSSRMILLLSFAWVLFYLLSSRWLLYLGSQRKNGPMEIILVGSEKECDTAEQLLKFTYTDYRVLKRLSPEAASLLSSGWKTLIRTLKPAQIIIGSANQNLETMMQIMGALPEKTEIRLLTNSKNAIIGSSSKESPGELHALDFRYHIELTSYKRQKRWFDLFFSFWIVAFLPVFIFLQKEKMQFLSNIYLVISGKKSWVGLPHDFTHKMSISNLKIGVLTALPFGQNVENHLFSEQYLIHYALYYSVWMDLDICIRNIQSLDKH